MQVKKQQLELDVKQLRKEYVKAVYCQLAYLIHSTSCTSCEMLASLNESQVGVKIAGRNINNLRYADDSTLMAESEEQLKSLLIRVKEEGENVGLKFNIPKMKIMASGPVTSWQIEGEEVETVTDFIFLGSRITVDGDCSHEIRHLLLGRKAMKKPRQCIKKQRYYFTNKDLYSQSYGFSSSHLWM